MSCVPTSFPSPTSASRKPSRSTTTPVSPWRLPRCANWRPRGNPIAVWPPGTCGARSTPFRSRTERPVQWDDGNRGGRAPELEDRATLEWMGRFIGRMHATGAVRPFRARPTLDTASFGEEPRDYLLSHGFIPEDLREAYESVVAHALAGVQRCLDR